MVSWAGINLKSVSYTMTLDWLEALKLIYILLSSFFLKYTVIFAIKNLCVSFKPSPFKHNNKSQDDYSKIL